MISGPPNIPAIAKGLRYGKQLAFGKINPSDIDVYPNEPKDIAEALWFRFMLSMFNGVLSFQLDNFSMAIALVLVIIISTLAEPVVSHAVLRQFGLASRWPSFITAYTWLGNFRILLVLMLFIVSNALSAPQLQLAAIPIGFWMLWATWFVATHSLKRGGLAGVGMVVLTIVLELILTFMLVYFINPELLAQLLSGGLVVDPG
jgi:hypothetical protein